MSGITKQTINTTNGGGQKVKASKLSTSLNGKKRRAVMVPADAAGGNKIVIKTRNGMPAPVSTNNNVVTTTCTVMNSGSSLLRDA